jgi:hypothetical protein
MVADLLSINVQLPCLTFNVNQDVTPMIVISIYNSNWFQRMEKVRVSLSRLARSTVTSMPVSRNGKAVTKSGL